MFHILRHISTKRDNCMKFRLLFPAVLIDFPNSKFKSLSNRGMIHCIKIGGHVALLSGPTIYYLYCDLEISCLRKIT